LPQTSTDQKSDLLVRTGDITLDQKYKQDNSINKISHQKEKRKTSLFLYRPNNYTSCARQVVYMTAFIKCSI